MVQLVSADVVPGQYLDWAVVHISVTNIAIIAAMVALFALALLLPFPGPRRPEGGGPR